MKYFSQINKIITKKQKRSAIFLFFLILLSMAFEILTLNSLFVLLSYTTNSTSLNDSQIFIYLKNLKLDYDINLIIILSFIFIFFTKTLINIYISWKENKFMFYTRAELSHIYFKGYLGMPSIFHLRTNTADLIKNITIEIEYFSHALKSLMTIAMEIIILLGLGTFLLFVNFKITLLSIIGLILFSIILSFINTKTIMLICNRRVNKSINQDYLD